MKLIYCIPKYIKCTYHILNSVKGNIGVQILTPRNKKIKDFCLFLPGRWQNSLMWAYENPKKDFRIFLSSSNYAVITLDYITHFHRDDALQTKILENYGIENFISDISTVLIFLKTQNIYTGILMGFSFGAALSLLAQSNNNIRAWTKRLVLFDGGIKDPYMKGIFNLEHNLKLNGTKLIENPSYNKYFRSISTLSKSNLFQDTQMQDKDFKTLLINGDRWWPNKTIIELQAIADYKFHSTLGFDRALKTICCPIICFYPVSSLEIEEAHRLPYSLSFTKSKNISYKKLKGFNHMEVLYSNSSRKEVFIPLLRWLNKVDL